MEPPKKDKDKEKPKQQQHHEKEHKVKVIEWEDFQQELARLSSLSTAVAEANHTKNLLQDRLQPLLELEAESLTQSNDLGEMRERLESRKLVMGNMSIHSKVVEEKIKMQEEQLSADIRSLLVAGTALSVANKRLQETSKSLSGERGYDKLRNAQKLLRLRQQHMVFQVSMLYPVKVVIGRTREQELESFSSNSTAGYASGMKPLDEGSITISGLHLTLLPFTKTSIFPDKKEVQRSATALGYVAHAVSLIASYLEVLLRYPLHLGGSRSHICDYAPSVEPVSSDSSSSSSPSTNIKAIEFPLFWEGQDTTRAAYGIFLLNKDLEQLLNFIGVESLGPRCILGNLKELFRTILSPEFINS